MKTEDYNLEEKLNMMESVEGSHLDIIATYIRFKKFEITNSKQLSLYISRNCKIAQNLTVFTTKMIQKAMEELQEDYEYRINNEGKKNNWKWGLETVEKQLMK